MVKIIYRGNRENIKQAVRLSNQLLKDPRFYERISEQPFFEMADVTPGFIATLIKKTNIKMNIKFYFSHNQSHSYGYDDVINPNSIPMNIWTIDRPAPSLCNTMLHACVHAVNAKHPQYNFGHNEPQNHTLENAAPNWIGNLAQKMVSGDENVTEIMLHDTDVDVYAIFECLVLPVS